MGLLVRVAGTGRAVSTLREAAGDDRRFPEQVTVIGRVGGGRSQLWYRAAGLADGRIALRMGRYARGTASLALYRPRERTRWNFYYPLVTGARPKGLAFSTPLDLSPVRDDRPFFDHAGRMLLAPTAALLPDEPGDARDPGTPRIVPPGDRAPLLVLAAALAALLAGGLLSMYWPFMWLATGVSS